MNEKEQLEKGAGGGGGKTNKHTFTSSIYIAYKLKFLCTYELF
jgi:hypothetical protein